MKTKTIQLIYKSFISYAREGTFYAHLRDKLVNVVQIVGTQCQNHMKHINTVCVCVCVCVCARARARACTHAFARVWEMQITLRYRQ